jgi:hypothetical protein
LIDLIQLTLVLVNLCSQFVILKNQLLYDFLLMSSLVYYVFGYLTASVDGQGTLLNIVFTLQ